MFTLLACLHIFLHTVRGEPVVVETRLGPVAGSLRSTDNGQDYVSYQGLPYAAPPVGQLRLLPPRPHEPWSQVLDLTKDSEVLHPSELSTMY